MDEAEEIDLRTRFGGFRIGRKVLQGGIDAPDPRAAVFADAPSDRPEFGSRDLLDGERVVDEARHFRCSEDEAGIHEGPGGCRHFHAPHDHDVALDQIHTAMHDHAFETRAAGVAHGDLDLVIDGAHPLDPQCAAMGRDPTGTGSEERSTHHLLPRQRIGADSEDASMERHEVPVANQGSSHGLRDAERLEVLSCEEAFLTRGHPNETVMVSHARHPTKGV
ncbi:MAG: hypothetical protein DHS20C19_22680 [Acidimicrobiales bacterium]|nr:MAG: hypothetical protein DHS20C19_22680 [Acidimicrobiales bacterium]